MRFHSAPVIRVADAKPVHLGHAVKADGAGDFRLRRRGGSGRAQLRHPGACATFSASRRNCPSEKYTPDGNEIDLVIDVRAVFQQPHHALAIETMPPFLLPGRDDMTAPLREDVLRRP